MNALTVLKALGPIDLKSVRRDSFLSWMVAIPLILALLVRWLTPEITAWLATAFGFALEPYYRLIVGYGFVILTPPLFGMVIGFLLLDERDDRTLLALQVTPMSLTGYLLYRLAVPTVLSVVITLVIIPLANLVSIPLGLLLAVALLAALEAPIFTLVLAAFAENKVAGFALVKGLGVFFLAPIVGYFIQPPWQLLIGIIPTYWPVKTFWVADQGDPGFWAYWLAGILIHAGLLAALVQRFDRVMHR